MRKSDGYYRLFLKYYMKEWHSAICDQTKGSNQILTQRLRFCKSVIPIPFVSDTNFTYVLHENTDNHTFHYNNSDRLNLRLCYLYFRLQVEPKIHFKYEYPLNYESVQQVGALRYCNDDEDILYWKRHIF
nr:hypothetical protein [Erythrotrichia longistipitata]